jgi:hypothetical protein
LALISTVFAQAIAEAASTQRRAVANQLRGKSPKLATTKAQSQSRRLALCLSPARPAGFEPTIPWFVGTMRYFLFLMIDPYPPFGS